MSKSSIGHRRSIYIDLFTSIGYGSMNTSAIKSFLYESFPYTENLKTLDESALGYSVRIGNSPYECIKVDLFYTENFIYLVQYIDGFKGNFCYENKDNCLG